MLRVSSETVKTLADVRKKSAVSCTRLINDRDHAERRVFIFVYGVERFAVQRQIRITLDSSVDSRMLAPL